METGLQFVCGAVVGLSLGLTGGGGSLIGVPLLVYVVGLDLRLAIGTSLASVSATSLSGAIRRLIERQVDVRTGILFVLFGGSGAYFGTRMNAWVPAPVLLVLLALVIGSVAFRMWRKGASRDKKKNQAAQGELRPLWLAPTAFAAGVLSGFFGVGGGFLIVPALALVGGLSMGTAIATSLMVIALNTALGVVSYALQGRPIDYGIAAVFIAGGLSGMWLGQKVGGRLDERTLARVFAVVLVLVAGFLLYKNLQAI